jgi:hypothetical protein
LTSPTVAIAGSSSIVHPKQKRRLTHATPAAFPRRTIVALISGKRVLLDWETGNQLPLTLSTQSTLLSNLASVPSSQIEQAFLFSVA